MIICSMCTTCGEDKAKCSVSGNMALIIQPRKARARNTRQLKPDRRASGADCVSEGSPPPEQRTKTWLYSLIVLAREAETEDQDND